jgi:hypothetical protein
MLFKSGQIDSFIKNHFIVLRVGCEGERMTDNDKKKMERKKIFVLILSV